MKSWEVWTGNGKQRIAPWVKLAWGGRNWPQSHGPGQGGQQAKPVGRGGWRASESSGSWSQLLSTTPSCWKPPWQPLWWSGLSPLTRHPSTYVWQRGSPATKLPLPTGIRPTYRIGEEKLDSFGEDPSGPTLGGGTPCRGCPSAEDYLSVTTKRHPISSFATGLRATVVWRLTVLRVTMW